MKIPWNLMELRITIYLAVVFVSLVLNAVIIAYLYFLLSQAEAWMASRKTRIDAVLGALGTTADGLAEASAAAADWSGRVRDEVEDLEPKMLEASSHVGYTLAKIDFEVDRFTATATDRLRSVTKRTKEKVAGPLTEVIAVIQGARALGHLVSVAAQYSEKTAEEGSPEVRPSERKVL